MAQLWIGNIDNWENEEVLLGTIKEMTGIQAISCSFTKEKGTNNYRNYGFITFKSKSDANEVLVKLKGSPIPSNPNWRFQINWANYSPDPNSEQAKESGGYQIYIGNLPNITENELTDFIKEYFPNVINVRIIYKNGVSRGYAFVKFSTMNEVQESIKVFNNKSYKGRTLRVNEATANRKSQSENIGISSNTNLFIDNIDPEVVKEDYLVKAFSHYGEVIECKIDPDHPQWAFVRMATRVQAESAKKELEGNYFGGTTKCTIDWARAVDKGSIQEESVRRIPRVKKSVKNKDLNDKYFDRDGIQKILKIIQSYSEICREDPFSFNDPIVANKNTANRMLQRQKQFGTFDSQLPFLKDKKIWFY